MKQVWKFKLTHGSSIGLRIPELSKFLKVELQGGLPTAWFLVAPDLPITICIFEIYGTGHDIPEDREYLGTWQDGLLVWHLFEVLKTIEAEVDL